MIIDEPVQAHGALVVISVTKKEVAAILIELGVLVANISLPFGAPSLHSNDGTIRYRFQLVETT